MRGWILAVAIAFAIAGISALAEDAAQKPSQSKDPKVVYPKHTDLDFEGAQIQGEVRNPGEFYFKRRPDEKFDSLVKRRKNFHPEMLRDAVLSK